jgi:glycosyltransferase involved in cell wall biosynthesis
MLGNSRLRQYLFAIDTHLFRKEGAPLGGLVSPRLQTFIRQTVKQFFLSSEGTTYHAWITRRIQQRKHIYKAVHEPGLLSFVTSVWNTPVEYLDVLARSLLEQCDSSVCEWIILDNGSTSAETVAYLEGLQKHPQVKLSRVPDNLGIIGGVRHCLERASNRYIVPLDSDDFLYPDCIQIVTAAIQMNGYPLLLYTDEDKLLGNKPTSPYFKPGWDPVLFLNSAYTAHLGVIDREHALELQAYTDPNATGSHDWDTFVRFLLAGFSPVHISEIVYSWRMHAQSTALNINSKSFIHSSQRAVLERFLGGLAEHDKYWLDYSPLFNGTPDWWIRRKHDDPVPLHCIFLGTTPATTAMSKLTVGEDFPEAHASTVPLDASPDRLAELVKNSAGTYKLVLLVSDRVEIKMNEWYWEALTLMEIHPDTVMVGGRIFNGKDIILDAGRYLGFGDGCGCPDRGRSLHDPGYFAQMWKQRSVSAVSTQFCVVKADFLLEMLEKTDVREISLRYMGAWAGAYALRTGKRIVYSPFLSALSNEDWQRDVSQRELNTFVQRNKDILPDRRFYPEHLSIESRRPYQPASDENCRN